MFRSIAGGHRLARSRSSSSRDPMFGSGLHRTCISGVERGIRNLTVLVLYEIAVAFGFPAAQLCPTLGQSPRNRRAKSRPIKRTEDASHTYRG
jgi:hypothetical protein